MTECSVNRHTNCLSSRGSKHRTELTSMTRMLGRQNAKAKDNYFTTPYPTSVTKYVWFMRATVIRNWGLKQHYLA